VVKKVEAPPPQVQLVLRPSYTVDGQAGCCGIGTVYRLSSATCSPSQRDANLTSWYNTPNPYAIGSDNPEGAWEKMSMKQILKATEQRPQGVLWGGRIGSSYWFGNAILADIAYSAVLETMERTKYAIYFMSDNMDGQGDTHIGPFNTRGFVSWLRQHELGQLQSTGPIQSLRTQRNINGWMFTPNWQQCAKRAELAKAQLITMYKGYNDDERIKKAHEQRCKVHNTASKALRKALGGGWTGTSFGRLYG